MNLKWLFYLIFTMSIAACSALKNKQMVEQLPNGHFSIRYNNIDLEIDPDLGARVISAKINDDELLLQERDSLMNWGSTFWLGPQSLWNWPPPEAIQLGKYASEIHGNKLKLTSEIDKRFEYRVTKTFQVNERNNCLEIEYQIINEADSARQIGPWEITVIPSEGAKVFFPAGQEPQNTKSNIQFENKNEIAWFAYEHENMSDWQKMFHNPSAGWLAHINKNRTLFIKTFEIVSPNEIAPGQGNVEVYISKKSEYIELENHGKYTLLQPGASLAYKVNWYLTQLPTGINTDEHSEELIKFVIEMVQ